MSGTARDTGGVGFDGTLDVEYKLDGGAWTALTLSGTNWSKSDLDLGATQGTHTLTFRSTDKLGNTASAGPLTLYYDNALPALSETLVGTTDPQYRMANLGLGGTASDTNGLASLTVNIDGLGASSVGIGIDIDGPNNVAGTSDDGGAWTYTVDVDTDGAGADSGLAEGLHILVFTVIDAAGKTASVTRTVVVDTTAPSVSVAAVSGYVSGVIPISGSASDANLTVVEYQLGGTAGAWTSASGTGTWTGSLDLTTSAEGPLTLYVRSSDRAGSVSSNATTTVNVDRANPRATETNYTSSLIQANSSIVFAGVADDASITGGRPASNATLTWTKDGVAGTDVPLTPVAGSWTWTLNVNTGTHADDGLYLITVLATDAAGKTASVTRSAQVDTTVPTLTVSAPVNGESTTNSVYAIGGTARDTGGVGFDGAADIEYKLDAGSWTSLTLSGTNWSKSDLNLGATQGSHILNFRSTDKLGNIATLGPLTLYYDNALPTVSESTIGTTDARYRKTNITYGGTIGDTNGLTGFTISVDGGTATAAGISVTDMDGADNQLGTADDGGAWTYTADVDTDGAGADPGLAEETHSLVFSVTDIAGKTASLTRTVVVDTTVPTASVVAVSGYVSGTIPISGTSSDANLSGVEYQLGGTGGAWTAASGTTSWTGSLDLSSAAEGALTLYVRSLDRAGNYSINATTTVNVDRASPIATETNYSSTLVQTNASITLAGAASDASVTGGRAASGAVLTWSKDGGAGTNEALTLSSGTWSWPLTVDTVGQTTDGLYLITVVVTDIAGKTTSVSRSVQVDTTAPTLTVIAPVNLDSSSSLTIAINGSSRDLGGVGFDGTNDVEFQIGAGAWAPLSLSGSLWSKADAGIGPTEGNYAFNFRSTDKLGNQALVGPINVAYDTGAPTLTEPTVSPKYTFSNVALSGTVSDTGGLSAFTVSVDGGAATSSGITVDIDGTDNSLGTPDDGGTWLYTADVDTDGGGADTGLAEGTHTLTFRVTDTASKIVTLSKTVIVDTALPTVTVNAVAGYVSGSIAISGASSDANPDVVEYQLGSTAGAWTSASGTGSWTAILDLSAATEGASTLYARATDRAGNVSTNAMTTINVDRAAPRATETNYTSALIQTNATITFQGIADDAGVTSGQAASSAALTWSKDGGTGTNVALSPTPGTGAWNWALNVNGATHADDGLYLITVLVTDAAGKTASVTRSAQVDTIAPTLTASAPVNMESTSTQIYAMSGTTRDTGGVGFDGTLDVEYKLDSGAWAELTLSGTNWSKPDLDLGATQGSHSLTFRSTDKLGNASTIGALTLYFDSAVPTLTETSIGTADPQYRNANVVLGGTASDTNGLASIASHLALTVSVDGAPASETGISIDINGADDIEGTSDDGGPWAYTVDIDTDGAGSGDTTGLAEGTHSLAFTVKDAAGKTSTLTRTVVVDTTAPTATVAPVSGYVSGVIPISGTAADTNLSVVEYQLGGVGGAWTLTSGTGTWTGSLDLTSATEGSMMLYVRSRDRAGNASANAMTTVEVDRANPRATEINYGSSLIQTSATIAFSGVADDAAVTSGQSAASAALTWSKDGGSGTNVALSPTPGTGAWSWSLNVNGATHADDGLYLITVLVTDAAGKTASVTRSAQVDTIAPILAVSAPVHLESTSNQIYAMSGTSRDTGGVGFDGTLDVEYKLDSGSWIGLTLSGTNWSKPDLDLGSTQGSHLLTFRSTDKLGNASTVGPLTLYYDNASPSLGETAVGTTDPQYSNVNLAFSGTVSDTNGLASLTVSIDGGAAGSSGIGVDLDGPGNVLGTPDDGGAWTYTVDVDTDGAGSGDTSGLSAGSHTLVFEATDAAGKKTSVTRTVVADTTAPAATVAAVSGYVSGVIPISGTASDANLSAVEYQLGGTAGAWTSASGTSTWTGSLDLTSAAEGAVTLYVRSRDRAGNASPNATTVVNIDRANPRATETSYTSALIQTNVSISFAGVADDAAVTGGRAATSAVLTWSKDGGAGTDAALAPVAGAWTWTLNVNAATHADDGLYLITLLVTDAAGKTASVTRSAQVDTTAPTLVVSAPVNNEATSNSVYAISGTSRDTGGVGFDGTLDVEYRLDAGAWTGLTLSGTSWSKADVDLGATQGAHALTFRSTDKLGNAALIGPVTLHYDNASPVLSELAVGTTDPQYRNANLVLAGAASDTNGLSSLLASVDGGTLAATGITVDLDGTDNIAGTSDDGGAWNYTADIDTDGAGADTGLTEGTHALSFQVADAAGKTTSLTRTIVVDTTLPTAAVAPVAGYVSGVIPISGTAADANMSVVEYQLGSTAGAWTSASGTGTWTGSLDLTSASEGSVQLYVRSRDMAGNVSTNASTAVNVDRANPRSQETNYTSSLIKTSSTITFAGIADDAAVTAGRSAASAILTWSKNGGTGTNVTLTPDGGGAWSWPLGVNAGTHENDGLYIITILVTDAAGKTASVTRSAQVDTTPPTLTVSAPVNGESTSNSVYAISGTARDTGGVGFDGAFDVEYRLDAGAWTELSLGGTNWTKVDLDLGAVQGTHVL
ncbi:MAG: hypothetical protein Q8M76_11235, partial [Spirochaetaceae bacterium]|nr:hypothetical protein [Spirochaetaceae bacterium]